MKIKSLVIYETIIGSLLIGGSMLAKAILQPEEGGLWSFMGGLGAGLLICVPVAALIEWQGIRKNEEIIKPARGSQKLLLLVFGGLALVFAVLFLIFG